MSDLGVTQVHKLTLQLNGMYVNYTFRKIIWINGPFSNSSLTWIRLNESYFTSVVGEISPIDISVDPVSAKLILVAVDGKLYSYDFQDNPEEIYNLENDRPVALDVFEVFAYVLLNSGIIVRISIQGDFSQGNDS